MDDMQTIVKALAYKTSYKNKDGSYNKLKESSQDLISMEDGGGMTVSYGKLPVSADEILILALNAKAADVHFTVGAPPKYRIMNELRPIPEYGIIKPNQMIDLLRPLLTGEQLQQFEQDGEIDFAYTIKDAGRFRCNFYKQRGTWAAVFRMLSNTIPLPQELGLPEVVQKLIDRKRGLILVTGPTGSGKTTTLASLINEINKKYQKNIITLEDPIEYLHKHNLSNVNQREIGLDSKSFASALRAALREDPDVILIGEMRDYETMSIAVTAAETGHLVLSTLHTIGAANTIDRILDTFPMEQQNQARSQLSNVIEGIVSQQLIPKRDGTGRIAAFEIMLGNIAVRNLIREGNIEQLGATIQTYRQDGMCLLDDNLIAYVKNGWITPDDAISFAVNQKIVREQVYGGR